MEFIEEILLEAKKEGQLNPHLQAMTDEELLEWWAHRSERREQTSQKKNSKQQDSKYKYFS